MSLFQSIADIQLEMAGNFWLSSHYQQWILSQEEILMERQQDLKSLTKDEYQKLMIFFCRFIQSLGEHLKLRQQVIATGTIYFKRFYSRNSLKSIDPLLLAPTCVFLAAKVEECGVITNTRLISGCTSVIKSKFAFAFPSITEYPYRINQIWECEFYILEVMDCSLIIFHPYRSLTKYIADMGQEDSFLPIAWRIVNDSLRTDACLMYPPYMISLTAIYMTCVIQQKDCKQWFAELTVDMQKIMEITQIILALYELWKTFKEKEEIQSILLKMPKPKSSPNSRPSSATPRNHTPSPVPGLH